MGRSRYAVNCIFRNSCSGSVSLQFPCFFFFFLFSFLPFLSMSAHRGKNSLETKMIKINICGNQDVKSNTTSAKNDGTFCSMNDPCVLFHFLTFKTLGHLTLQTIRSLLPLMALGQNQRFGRLVRMMQMMELVRCFQKWKDWNEDL